MLTKIIFISKWTLEWVKATMIKKYHFNQKQLLSVMTWTQTNVDSGEAA